MERKIGEIFEYNGEWLQCVEQPKKYDKTVCAICDFHGIGNCELDKCSGTYRSDKKSIIFKKLGKVGEPLKIHNRLVLRVKADAYKCMNCCFYSKGKCELTMQECEHYDCGEENKFIEIKQNKEDMEEKKLSLKPFDIQKAREGKPVCTRDGIKARIIAFDRRLFYKNVSYPILALVERSDGEDDVCGYNEKGKVLIEDGAEYKDDLMMLPEKKEGWVNVAKEPLGDDEVVLGYIFNSYEDAVRSGKANERYVATVRIEWEG